ncbi:MAG: DNA-directed RNA polymerase subunit omega [Oligoflexia bacterium]|nr:DNA-directed RNA polymerase subunit omega [Oligoflexia bacterium]
MARITVEDCLTKEKNRFALVQLASKRAKQLLHGARSVIIEPRSNKSIVMALREIATGQVRFMTDEEKRLAQEAADREREARMAAEAEARARNTVLSGPDSLFKSAAENGGHNGEPAAAESNGKGGAADDE